MTGERSHVVLVNAWHDDNKGDSAITDGTLQILQHAYDELGIGVDFTVVGLNEVGELTEGSTRHVAASWPAATTLPMAMPTELRSGHRVRPLVDVPIWFWRLAPSVLASMTGRTPRGLRDLIASADALIVIGGSNLHDAESVNALVSLARLYTLVAPIPPAANAGLPVLLLGHTLGPFPPGRRIATAVARRMIGRADIAVVRESESIVVAEGLGITRVELAPDMAFALTPTATERVRLVLDGRAVPAARTAVVAVRRHPFLGRDADARLMAEVIAAVAGLVDRGLCDAVMVVAHTIGPTPIEDDRDFSQELAARIVAEHPAIPTSYLHDDLSPAELAWLYGQMACMISVRLHAAILAMLDGTPTFAIAYFTHKTGGVMAGVGLGDCVGEFATVTGADIVDALAPRIGSQRDRDALAALCRVNRRELKTRCTTWIADVVRPTAEERTTA